MVFVIRNVAYAQDKEIGNATNTKSNTLVLLQGNVLCQRFQLKFLHIIMNRNLISTSKKREKYETSGYRRSYISSIVIVTNILDHIIQSYSMFLQRILWKQPWKE
uniref:Putative ovule protein n=1 Tax=Solanum chacoense TaxID=4108 RepID=A0A0V0GU38_SOLCH